jgi:hypothetical protein
MTRVTPKGEEILSIVGRIPFQHEGLFKKNVDTGDVLHVSRDVSERQLEQACAAPKA